MATLEDYATVLQAAQVLGVHPETVKRLIRQGDLHAAKVRNTWLIHKNDLASFAASYRPQRGPGSRFRRMMEERAKYEPRQLRLGQE